MGLIKLSKSDFERLRASGASIRTKGGKVNFTKAQLDQFRDAASAKRIPSYAEAERLAQPVIVSAPEINMDSIHDAIHEAVDHAFAQRPKPKAPTYHFEVTRDAHGFIESIHATPVK